MAEHMMIFRRSRLTSAALLTSVALILAAIVCTPVLQVVPVRLSANERDATVNFSADDTTVFVDSDCIRVQWQVENVSAIEVDGDGVVGQGSRRSCNASSVLEVTFRDGSKQQFTIDKQIRLGSTAMRAMLVVAVFLLGLAVFISGFPTRLVAWWHSSALAKRLGGWLPKRPPEVDDVRARPAVLFAVVAIVLIGAAVRTFYLTKSLRYDESSTYMNYASKSLDRVVADYDAPNNHIFHTILVHETTALFGIAIWTLRLPAYFAGILVVAATFAVGRRFYGVRAGLLAAALAAASSWLVEYAVYARGYSLVTLDFLLLLLVAASLRRRQRAVRWLLFAVLAALGVFTIPIMVYPIGIVCLWLGLSIVAENEGRQRWLLLKSMALSLVAALGMTVLFYVPALLHILSQSLDKRFGVTDVIGWTTFAASYQREMGRVWLDMQRDLSPGIFAVLLAGFVLSILLHSRLSRYRMSLVGAAVLWLPAVFFAQQVATYDRLWVYIFPLWLVLAAAGVVYGVHFIAARGSPLSLEAFASVALVIAAVLAVGEVRSNSVQLAGGPGSVPGTEVVIRQLRGMVGDDTPVICANYCMAMDLYGLIYNVKLTEVSKQIQAINRPFYVVMTTTKPASKLDPLWQLLKMTPDHFQTVSVVVDTGDTALYRLVPVGASAS